MKAFKQEDVGNERMSDTEPTGSVTPYSGGEGRERGARRKKLYGYLKAANEIRQSYSSQWGQADGGAEGEDQGMPGMFPDIEVVRNGDEEMVLFPSYARKHIKKNPSAPREKPGTHEDIDRPQPGGDAEYWKKEWERFEDDNAIVDVDVRGWVYSPPRGPMNRKNRLLVAVARRLSGIPAPTNSPENSRSSSLVSTTRTRMEERTSRHEEEAAAKQAQSLVQRGEGEADAAWKGSYSQDTNGYSPMSSRSSSPIRSQSTSQNTFLGDRPRSISEFSMGSDDEDPAKHALAKRRSWAQPANMSKEELAVAHANLMSRLKPFMTAPIASTPITIFFFNDEKSQSKSVTTNESGHFNVRASLDFVPTSVRVLASERLSATEAVLVSEARGVSLISDIDDTIKHSAIASGAKEIFKNTFIRDLADLTIQGVKEWYTKMYSMGVKLHYVSNSPWQLYPLLRSYFSLAGLPPGSFHLKQYSGMLQGIFEPAAERKRGSLDRIMEDFPERRFVLVGDSGEADLEVYTDVVLAHPGKVLAVFIRDVTTTEKKKFFDQATSNVGPGSRSSSNGHYASRSRLSDEPEVPPTLPERRNAVSKADNETEPVETNLIDFDDESEVAKGPTLSYSSELLELNHTDHEAENGHKAQEPSGTLQHRSSTPPTRPTKPAGLRSPSIESRQSTNHDRISKSEADKSRTSTSVDTQKPPPPKPRRSSASVHVSNVQSSSQPQGAPFASSEQNQGSYAVYRPDLGDRSSTSATLRQSSSRPKVGPRTLTSTSTRSTNSSSREDEGYAASARRQLNSAYNALPSLRSNSPAREDVPGSKARNPSDPSPQVPPPPMPPRRGLTSYPMAAARWATSSTTGASGGDPAAGGGGGAPAGAPYNKKEEMWNRRWARARQIMKREGVVLKSWRVGTDVMDECVKIVEGKLRELKHEEGGMGQRRKRH